MPCLEGALPKIKFVARDSWLTVGNTSFLAGVGDRKEQEISLPLQRSQGLPIANCFLIPQPGFAQFIGFYAGRVALNHGLVQLSRTIQQILLLGCIVGIGHGLLQCQGNTCIGR